MTEILLQRIRWKCSPPTHTWACKPCKTHAYTQWKRFTKEKHCVVKFQGYSIASELVVV